jgi:DNA-binding NarL/FixJ family response regulator
MPVDQGVVVETPTSRQSVVLVCERDRIVGEFAGRYLRGSAGLGEVIVTQSNDEAVDVASQRRPRVVVIGSTDDSDGTELASTIRSASTDTAIVMFAERLDHALLRHAVRSGYSGVVCRRTSAPEELLVAVRAAAQGLSHFTHEVMSVLADAPPVPAGTNAVLSTREREVIALLVQSRSTKEIAAEMFISQHTVRNHVRHILTKLNARTKLEAIVRAAQLGLVAIPARPGIDPAGSPR